MEISTSVISRRQTTHTVIPVERHRYWYRLTNSRSGFPSPAPSMNWLRNHNFLVGSGQGQWRKSRERRATFFEIQIDVKGFHFNVWSRKPITRRLASSFSFRRVLHTLAVCLFSGHKSAAVPPAPTEWMNLFRFTVPQCKKLEAKWRKRKKADLLDEYNGRPWRWFIQACNNVDQSNPIISFLWPVQNCRTDLLGVSTR